MKALVDTCIIIDYLQKRRPFDIDAGDVVLAAASNCFYGYITTKSVTDIYYLMHRSFHDDRKTRDALSKLLLLFFVLDTTASDCQLAVLSPVGDYEDAVMAETALRSGMDCIVTRNVRDFDHSSVPVYSPREFLRLL